jgi:hypothetical protein
VPISHFQFHSNWLHSPVIFSSFIFHFLFCSLSFISRSKSTLWTPNYQAYQDFPILMVEETGVPGGNHHNEWRLNTQTHNITMMKAEYTNTQFAVVRKSKSRSQHTYSIARQNPAHMHTWCKSKDRQREIEREREENLQVALCKESWLTLAKIAACRLKISDTLCGGRYGTSSSSRPAALSSFSLWKNI